MTIRVFDLKGNITVVTEDELITRLKSVRNEVYGAFMLSHEDDYPALVIHINKDIAYLHYWPNDEHPGYQARDMHPDGCPNEVHFLQTDGNEGASFDMPDYTLVGTETAYLAAVEFFGSSGLPASVEWSEL